MLSHRDHVHTAKLALPLVDLLLLGTARSCCLHLTSTCVYIFVLNKKKTLLFQFVLLFCSSPLLHPPSRCTAPSASLFPRACSHSARLISLLVLLPAAVLQAPRSCSVLSNTGAGRTKRKLQPGATQIFPSHFSFVGGRWLDSCTAADGS